MNKTVDQIDDLLEDWIVAELQYRLAKANIGIGSIASYHLQQLAGDKRQAVSEFLRSLVRPATGGFGE